MAAAAGGLEVMATMQAGLLSIACTCPSTDDLELRILGTTGQEIHRTRRTDGQQRYTTAVMLPTATQGVVLVQVVCGTEVVVKRVLVD